MNVSRELLKIAKELSAGVIKRKEMWLLGKTIELMWVTHVADLSSRELSVVHAEKKKDLNRLMRQIAPFYRGGFETHDSWIVENEDGTYKYTMRAEMDKHLIGDGDAYSEVIKTIRKMGFIPTR